MFDIVHSVLAIVLLIIGAWVVWESSKMISEKKERRRRGLTDYYDNPIKKEKDETIS